MSEDRFLVGIRIAAFNWRMRQARQSKGLTQQQLADIVGVRQTSISALETFRHDHVSWDTLDDIASALESSVDEMFPPWFQARVVREVINGDVPISVDRAALEGGLDPFRFALRRELIRRLGEAVATLPPRKKQIIEWRFGLHGQTPKTLSECGIELGITRGRVRELEVSALSQLRRPRAVKRLQAYIDDDDMGCLSSSDLLAVEGMCAED